MHQGLDYELARICNDTLSLHKPDGSVFRDIKARVSTSVIFIIDGDLLIEVGDKLVRTRPTGIEDVFIVVDPGYQAPILGLPAHFQVKVRRVGIDSGVAPDVHGPQKVVEPLTQKPAREKPGPKTDREASSRVLEIVTRVAGSDPWKTKLDDICDALDEARIPRPKTWVNRKPPLRSWADAAMEEPELAKKAIAYQLKRARG
jgi:hypothetical protein